MMRTLFILFDLVSLELYPSKVDKLIGNDCTEEYLRDRATKASIEAHLDRHISVAWEGASVLKLT